MEEYYTHIVIGLIISILVLLPFALRALASMTKFFTFRVTNGIQFIEKAVKNNPGILVEILIEVPGKILNFDGHNFKSAKIERSEEKEKLSFFNEKLKKYLGIHFFGLFNSVKELEIPREKENPEGTGPTNWLIKNGMKKTKVLKPVFPRSYIIMSVELKDGFTVHLLVTLKLKVVIPYIPIYEFGNNFFEQTGSILKSEIISEMQNFTIFDFLLKPKGEVSGFLSHYKEREPDTKYSKINEELIRQVGLCITGISISDWSPGDQKTEELIKKVATAQIEGDAAIMKAEKQKAAEIIDAEKYASVLGITTEADKLRGEIMAKVREKYINATILKMKKLGANPDLVVSAVKDILKAEEIAKAGLSSYVEGKSDTITAFPVQNNSGGRQ